MIRRGEVYWVNLDPAVGSEIKKTRPGLIVSNDINNAHAQTVTVVPLSTKVAKIYPFEVLLPEGSYGNKVPAKAKAEQVRTVSQLRLGRLLGLVPPELMLRVDDALRLHLSL